MVFGSAALNASGGLSGNPVVFASMTPLVCSVSGASAAFAAIGICRVSANQAGNANYAAAAQVTIDIAVGLAAAPALTIPTLGNGAIMLSILSLLAMAAWSKRSRPGG